jgi:hypothetical protein
MWTLKIMQKRPYGDGDFKLDDFVLFESENIEKLLNLVEYTSCIRAEYETEFLIQKKEDNNDGN